MSKSLHSIIKTLTKGEKKLFKTSLLNTKRKSYYSKMVSVYSKADIYSSVLDQEIFKDKEAKFVTSCKNTFKKTILDFLTHNANKEKSDKKVTLMCEKIRMLIDRRQFEEADKLLKKAEPIAIMKQFYGCRLDLIKSKILIYRHHCDVNKTFDTQYVKNLIKERKQVMKDLEQRISGFEKFVLDGDKRLQSKNYTRISYLTKSEKPASYFYLQKYNKHRDSFTENYKNKQYKKAIINLKAIISILEQNNFTGINGKEKFSCLTALAFLCNILYTIGNFKPIPRYLALIENLEMPCDNTNTYKNSYLLIIKANYALGTNKIKFGFDYLQIPSTKKFLTKLNDNNENLTNIIDAVVMLQFAHGYWSLNTKYISNLFTEDLLKHRVESNITIDFVKLIIATERKNVTYANSILKQLKYKSQKMKLKEEDKILIAILSAVVKLDFSKLPSKLNDFYNQFKLEASEKRYFIYWLLSKYPKLKDNSYSNFLNKYNFKDYNFPVSR